ALSRAQSQPCRRHLRYRSLQWRGADLDRHTLAHRMAATLAHPLRGVLTTDPGTTRATDRLADAVLRAVDGYRARPGRDDGAERSGDRAARAAGPGAPNSS